VFKWINGTNDYVKKIVQMYSPYVKATGSEEVIK